MARDNQEHIYAMRHSLAHIMATAVTTLWPEARLGVGPVVDNGFYYDIDIPGVTISESDFKKIELEMRKVVNLKQPFEKTMMPILDALEWAKKSKQPYKQELLNDLYREGTTLASELDVSIMGLQLPAAITGTSPSKAAVGDVSFYTNGSFTDLCRGPHVEDTGKVGAFKLMRVAGAYWRGNEKNPQMQRLYGVAFATKEELADHLAMLEEAKKRDHRKLGREMDLFVFSDMVGSGLPIFTPRGTVLREELAKFSNELRKKRGFEQVWTPHITKKDLYEKSGHWAKFGDELFLVKSQETSDELVMKPMNCPHHTRIFESQQRSYRDMPVRYLETTTDYRDEKSGELGGLNRVRALTQDDSHVFCRPDQIGEEIDGLLAAARELYAVVGMELRVRLSYRDDSDAYLGEMELWENAQKQLKEAVVSNDLQYYEQEGEAAFYGPKIDFMATDAIGREHQVATVQLDFVQPARFELVYNDMDGETKTPVMIHCALLGSIERFLSVYIEHTGGRFPVWNAPEQIRVITVNQEDATIAFAEELRKKAFNLGLRVKVDNDNESVGKKIRSSAKDKVPYTLVLGEQEIANGEVTPRIREDLQVQEPVPIAIDNFLKTVANEVASRTSKSS